MKIRTPLLASALVVTAIGCGGSDDSSSDSTSMVALLERMPLTALDDPDGGRLESAQISMGDTVKAAGLAELPRPSSNDVDASIQWYVDLSIAGPVEQGGTGYSFDGTDFPQFSSEVRLAEAIGDEFGFTPFAIDSYVAVSAPPTQMAVFAGDLTLSDDLVDVGEGIVSAGEGDDFVVDPATRTAIRPLGRPHLMAESDGQVAVSLSTPLIADWLADGASLADDPNLDLAAAALDAGGSVAATLFVSEFEGFGGPPSPIEAPFSVVGIGTAEVEGAAGNVIVYVFEDSDGAEQALPAIEDGWRDGALAARNAPVAEFFDIVSVEQDDRTVIVTANVTDIATTRTAFEMVLLAEPLFTHSN